MKHKFTVGSGFYCKPDQTFDKFFPIWWDNLHRYAEPKEVIILAAGTGPRPVNKRGKWIELPGDLGHVHDLNGSNPNVRKPYHWCGWSISFVTLALLAYANESDFLYVEQDVLAFGPYVDRMYQEIGGAGMIFGRAKCMPAVQSLVLCKFEFIPEFVRLFMGTGSEQLKKNEGELKFLKLEQDNPGKFARYSFGFDRDRPFNLKEPIFYLQHIMPDEMRQLVKAGLLPKDTPILENQWAK